MSARDLVTNAQSDFDAAVVDVQKQGYMSVQQRLEFAQTQALIAIADSLAPKRRRLLRRK